MSLRQFESKNEAGPARTGHGARNILVRPKNQALRKGKVMTTLSRRSHMLLLFVVYTFGLSSTLAGQVVPTFSVRPIHPDVPLNGPINSIAVDPGNERHILVASETGGMFSTRDGINWTHEDSLDSDRVRAIVYLQERSPDFTEPRAVAAASEDFEANGVGIWTYAGAPYRTWGPVSRGATFPAPGPTCPAASGAWDIAIAPDTRQVY